MTILAIDVGNTCGVCRMTDEGAVEMTCNIHAYDVEQSALIDWSGENGLQVVIEYPAPSLASSTATLRYVTDLIKELYPRAYITRPGVWKSSAVAAQPLPKGAASKLTAHEKDAINIARWYRLYLERQR